MLAIKVDKLMTHEKLITLVMPCFNEAENVNELYQRVTKSIDQIEAYAFEMLFIDNASTDNTVDLIKDLAAQDKRVRLIVNERNFGHIKSPYYGILQSRGLATIYLASDLQDPPEKIAEFISYWEKGFKLVLAVKPTSKAKTVSQKIRLAYYQTLDRISDISVVNNSNGFGLYDQAVVQQLRAIEDPYPFLRGLIAELGYPVKTIEIEYFERQRGISKNNAYTLYDIAWLGIVSHSKLPVRLAAMAGFLIGGLSVLAAVLFFILKLIFWQHIPFGIAPLMIGMFFLFGMQFIFIGVLGEYVGTILTYVQKRPIVVEKERVNFD
jgi:glycosyltransferase involved in cell wall biosynthesis